MSGLIDLNCRQATKFSDSLKAAGYAVLNDVVLSLKAIHRIAKEEGQRVQSNKGVQASGEPRA